MRGCLGRKSVTWDVRREEGEKEEGARQKSVHLAASVGWHLATAEASPLLGQSGETTAHNPARQRIQS